jgi:hypothetical protein
MVFSTAHGRSDEIAMSALRRNSQVQAGKASPVLTGCHFGWQAYLAGELFATGLGPEEDLTGLGGSPADCLAGRGPTVTAW